MDFLAENKKNIRLIFIAFAFSVSVLYDIFFWKQEAGIGYLLFIIIYLAGYLGLVLATHQLNNAKALLLLIPIIVLSADRTLYSNTFVLHLVPWIVFILLVLFTILVTLRRPEGHFFSFRNIPLVRHIDLPFEQWSHIYRDLFRRKSESHRDVYRNIAIGVLVSMPILLLFGTLFSGADEVFSQWMRNIFRFDIEASFIWRIFRTFILTLYIASFLYVALDEAYALTNHTHSPKKINPAITATILSLVNILFAVFVFIQFRYLFGSSDFVLENGLVFAEYARKGFFELVWVVVLALGLLCILYRSAATHGAGLGLKALKVLLMVQVGVIAYSALTRMNAYQDAYGFTVLRLYVEWFIYMIFVLLALFAGSVVRVWPFRNFLYTGLLLGLLSTLIVASLNTDRIIAERNIARYAQGEKIDVDYLLALSPDAIPAIAKFVYDKHEFNDRYTADMDTWTKDILTQRIKELEEKYNLWIEWNAGVVQAKKAVASYDNE